MLMLARNTWWEVDILYILCIHICTVLVIVIVITIVTNIYIYGWVYIYMNP